MKKTIKWLTFILAILLITSFSAFALDEKKKIEVSTDTVNLNLNGSSKKLNSISYNNKNYISVDDIAKSLGNEVQWDANTKTLSINQKNIIPQAQERKPNQINETSIKASEQSKQNSSSTIEGVITWQNNSQELKSDCGAKILLLPANITKNQLYKDDIFLFSNGRDFDKFKSKNVFAAKTDDNGKYKINNIAEGKYILIIVSGNANKNVNEVTDSYTASLLTPLSNAIDSSIDELSTILFRLNKYCVTDIEIVKGKTYTTKSNFTCSDSKQ